MLSISTDISVLKRESWELRTSNLDAMPPDIALLVKNRIVEIISGPFHSHDPWVVLNLLYTYTLLCNKNTRTSPDKHMVIRELNILKFFILNNQIKSKKYEFCEQTLWLCAKWGFYDHELLDTLIYNVERGLNRHRISSEITNLTRIAWAYASLLPLDTEPDRFFIMTWCKISPPRYKDIWPGSQLWGTLLPALEFLGIKLPYNQNPGRIAKQFIALDKNTISGFEEDVAYVLNAMKIAYKQNQTILVYRPDFIIERSGKQLILECDGDLFHPFPKLLRNKVLRQRGYYYTIITGGEYIKLDFSQKLTLLWQIIHELDAY